MTARPQAEIAKNIINLLIGSILSTISRITNHGYMIRRAVVVVVVVVVAATTREGWLHSVPPPHPNNYYQLLSKNNIVSIAISY